MHSTDAGRTQGSDADRTQRRASGRDSIERRVENIRALLASEAPRGFGIETASRMGWRKERIYRELSGVEKLSVSLLLAEVELHREHGRADVADRLIGLVTEGNIGTVPVPAGSVFRVFDRNGQLFLRLGE
jgi:hypothetical protein